MDSMFRRLRSVWKFDFLKNFCDEEHKDVKTTVWFWVVSNTFIAIIVSAQLFTGLFGSFDDVVETIKTSIPDNARVTIEDGQMTTENIDNPFFREINADHQSGDEYDESAVIIIDTESETYDITSFDAYDGGVIVLRDRAYIKDGFEIDELKYADVPNFSVTKGEVVQFVSKYFLPFTVLVVFVAFLFLLFFYAVIRLVSALWWALLLFILGKIFGVEIPYFVSYKAVLNLYFIPAFIGVVLGTVSLHIPFLVTAIFFVVFIGNLIYMKKEGPKKDEENTEDEEIKKLATQEK